MLAPELRRRVDVMWDRIWSSGVSNPLTAMEYFSTVLLLRRLAERRDGAGLWGELHAHVRRGDPAAVAAFMVRVQLDFSIGASPDVASPETWGDLETLAAVLADVEHLNVTDRNFDILGDLFEYLLNHLNTAGHFGQFRTPRHLVRFMVDVVDPRPGEMVVDPACGTAGFLIAAHEHRGAGAREQYVGDEVDATMVRLARTNTLLHGMPGASIRHRDALQRGERDADVVLANPPFAGSVVPGRAAAFESRSQRTELLFVELMMNRLVPGGRAAVVVPSGVLTGSTPSAVWIRRRLLQDNRLHAVVGLPSGVFRPYTSVKTALLFWSNDGPADDVLVIDVRADGYSLDDRREQLVPNDLPAAAVVIGGGEAHVPHARVSVAKIVADGCNLSPSRYIDAGSAPTAAPAPNVSDAFRATRANLALVDDALRALEATL